jgi:hypothetical protein
MKCTHVYRWRKYRPELFGRRCRLLARGSRNSCLVQFAGGELHVVSRFAVRKFSAGSAPLRENPAGKSSRRGAEAQR